MLSPSIDGEYFKLCKILRVFPGKFREYYRMNIKTFDYILDSGKEDLQGYSNFRKCIETEERLTVAIRYVLIIVVRININYICTMVNAIKIQCNLSLTVTTLRRICRPTYMSGGRVLRRQTGIVTRNPT